MDGSLFRSLKGQHSSLKTETSIDDFCTSLSGVVILGALEVRGFIATSWQSPEKIFKSIVRRVVKRRNSSGLWKPGSVIQSIKQAIWGHKAFSTGVLKTSPLRSLRKENVYFPRAEVSIGSQVAFSLSSALLVHQPGESRWLQSEKFVFNLFSPSHGPRRLKFQKICQTNRKTQSYMGSSAV